MIRKIIPLQGGGEMIGIPNKVKWIDSDGVPYIRYRYGKVDKPVPKWILADATPPAPASPAAPQNYE